MLKYQITFKKASKKELISILKKLETDRTYAKQIFFVYIVNN